MYILNQEIFLLILEPFTPLFSSVLKIGTEVKGSQFPSEIHVPIKKFLDNKNLLFSVADIVTSVAMCYQEGSVVYKTFLAISKKVQGDLEVSQDECKEVISNKKILT